MASTKGQNTYYACVTKFLGPNGLDFHFVVKATSPEEVCSRMKAKFQKGSINLVKTKACVIPEGSYLCETLIRVHQIKNGQEIIGSPKRKFEVLDEPLNVTCTPPTNAYHDKINGLDEDIRYLEQTILFNEELLKSYHYGVSPHPDIDADAAQYAGITLQQYIKEQAVQIWEQVSFDQALLDQAKSEYKDIKENGKWTDTKYKSWTFDQVNTMLASQDQCKIPLIPIQ